VHVVASSQPFRRGVKRKGDRVIGRSFRIGLRLGLLAGIAVAVVKTLQSRRAAMEQAPSWDWSPPPVPRPEPGVDITPAATPSAPDVETEAEPEVEPEPPALRVVPRPAAEDEPALRVVPPPTRDGADDDALDGMLDDLPPKPPAAPAPPAKAPAAEKPVAAERPAAPKKPAPKKAAAKQAAPKQAPAAKGPAAKKAGPRKAAAKKAATPATAEPEAPPPMPAWVEPVGNICPETHPVKAKLTSKLFHLPGMFAYPRTNPDRCYRDEEAATADGLTRAKR